MTSQQKLQQAMTFAMANRPQVGGFPFLAECLRLAGVERNLWTLPAVQSVYVMEGGVIVNQGVPLVTGMVDVPTFDEAALITAIRTDQAGESTFPEFLKATWEAGVVTYEVDFEACTVAYRSASGEEYIESYPAVEVTGLSF